MNKTINNYIIVNFLKVILNVFLVFFCIAFILGFFEEIEFFKNIDVGIDMPIFLTILNIPNLIIDLLPFIIFISTMWFIISIRANSDLLSLKIFGYSNLKIMLMLSFVAFVFGYLILFIVNPLSAAMIKKYEMVKAEYSRDVDHLVSINRNGVWIKEIYDNEIRVINAAELKGDFLKEVSIYKLDMDHNFIERIDADEANITNLPWIINNAQIVNINQLNDVIEVESFVFQTVYDKNKLNSLFRNLNTISFWSLITNYDAIKKIGYKKELLKERIHFFFSLPIFLLVMVFLACIFTIGSTNKKHNFYYVFVSLLTCAVIFYFKDLSVALGQTNRLSLPLSVWMPIIAVTLFCSIGVLQINEK
ncbi:MAG: Lipopolysaccharide export LptBFGC system, permease protein LptF [Pelagibacterales bacterium]|nr:Lipopolysaccharide export LptBFGC system, permease protein LptF [Pelagibacterales bacterium]